jgi:hypothetical protein
VIATGHFCQEADVYACLYITSTSNFDPNRIVHIYKSLKIHAEEETEYVSTPPIRPLDNPPHQYVVSQRNKERRPGKSEIDDIAQKVVKAYARNLVTAPSQLQCIDLPLSRAGRQYGCNSQRTTSYSSPPSLSRTWQSIPSAIALARENNG